MGTQSVVRVRRPVRHRRPLTGMPQQVLIPFILSPRLILQFDSGKRVEWLLLCLVIIHSFAVQKHRVLGLYLEAEVVLTL